jgi:uncharacterized protein (TIGR03435 family)
MRRVAWPRGFCAGLLSAAFGAGLVVALGLVAPLVFSQTTKVDAAPARPLTFDVISVKANRSSAPNADVGMNRDGFTATNIQLHELLLWAFQLQEDQQLVAEPKWTGSDRWDIQARVASEDIAALAKMTYRERLGMFQQIMVDRFGLKVHHETRVLPVYELVVAKGGPKMKLSPTRREDDPNGVPGDPGVLNPSRGREMGRGTMMEFLAEDLSDVLGRKVVDKTGLTRRYDFDLKWTPDDSAAVTGSSAGSGENQGPSLFTAVQEQLGLKLEPVKAPVDVVVIDHLEKPGEN